MLRSWNACALEMPALLKCCALELLLLNCWRSWNACDLPLLALLNDCALEDACALEYLRS
jgi:hypothetical protein